MPCRKVRGCSMPQGRDIPAALIPWPVALLPLCWVSHQVLSTLLDRGQGYVTESASGHDHYTGGRRKRGRCGRNKGRHGTLRQVEIFLPAVPPVISNRSRDVLRAQARRPARLLQTGPPCQQLERQSRDLCYYPTSWKYWGTGGRSCLCGWNVHCTKGPLTFATLVKIWGNALGLWRACYRTAPAFRPGHSHSSRSQ